MIGNEVNQVRSTSHGRASAAVIAATSVALGWSLSGVAAATPLPPIAAPGHERLLPPQPNIEPLPLRAQSLFTAAADTFNLVTDIIGYFALDREIADALLRAAPTVLPTLKHEGDGYAVQISIFSNGKFSIVGNGGDATPIGPGHSAIAAAADLYYAGRGALISKPNLDSLLRDDARSFMIFYHVKNGKITSDIYPGPGDLSVLAEGKRMAEERHAAEDKAAAEKAAAERAAAAQAAAAKAAADRAAHLAALQAAAFQQQQLDQQRQRDAIEQQARFEELQRERNAEIALQQAQAQAEQAAQQARMAEQQRQFAEQQQQQQQMFQRQQQLMQQMHGGGGAGTFGGGGPAMGGPP